jgi:hypothetical protein
VLQTKQATARIVLIVRVDCFCTVRELGLTVHAFNSFRPGHPHKRTVAEGADGADGWMYPLWAEGALPVMRRCGWVRGPRSRNLSLGLSDEGQEPVGAAFP